MSRIDPLWRRMGGPDAISWPAFWSALLVTIGGHFVAGSTMQGMIPERIALASLAVIAMFAWLLLARATFLHDTDATPRPWATLLAFVIAGVIRGIVMSGGLVALGVTSDPQWRLRISGGVVMMVPVFVICSLVVGSLREHQLRVRRLLASQRELMQAREHSEQIIAERNGDLIARVRARLITETDRLDTNRAPESLSVLQTLATDIVRPLSHELSSQYPAWIAIDHQEESGATDWYRAVDEALRGRPLQPVLASVTAILASLSFLLTSFRPAQALLLAGVTVAASAVVAVPANGLLARVLPGRVMGARIAAFLVVTLGVSAIVASSTLVVTRGSDHALVTALGTTMLLGFLLCLFAVLTSAIRQQEELEGALVAARDALTWQVSRTNQVQWFQQKQVSRALHGPIQTAATVAAIRLDGAIREGSVEPELVGALKVRILDAFASLDSDDRPAIGLDEAIGRLVASWAGICEVSVDVDPAAESDLSHDRVGASIVLDVLTESTSNAVRHGHAASVGITIRSQPGGLVEIVVANTGHAVGVLGPRGLGTRMIEECSIGWSFEPTADGCELRVLLPVG